MSEATQRIRRVPGGAIHYLGPPLKLGATPESATRRQQLLDWLDDKPPSDKFDARRIAAALSHCYPGPYGADRCFDDLKVLEKIGLVERSGRPAQWKSA